MLTDAKFLQAFEDEIVGMFSVVSFMSRRRSELFHMKPSQCSMSICGNRVKIRKDEMYTCPFIKHA